MQAIGSIITTHLEHDLLLHVVIQDAETEKAAYIRSNIAYKPRAALWWRKKSFMSYNSYQIGHPFDASINMM